MPPPTQDVSASNGGNNKVFCGLIGTATLSGNIPLYSGESVLWSQTSGTPVNITTPNNPSTTITGLTTSGTYCFNYNIKNNNTGCTSNSNVCYTLFDAGNLDGGPDIILPCNVTTVTIPTRITGTGELKYRIIGGPSNAFVYPTAYGNSNVIAGLFLPGTYRIEINFSSGFGCPTISDFVDVTVSRPPVVSNAGTDQNFACSSITTQLAGNDPTQTGLGTGVWSQVTGPNSAILPTPTNNVCDVKGTIPGKYIFRWTISGGNNCPDNFDDMVVIIPDTTITKPNAGTDMTICYNAPVTLNGNTFRVDETAKWSCLSNGISFNPSNTSSSVTITGLDQPNTSYTFVYTITNSCNISKSDSIIVTTNNTVGPSIANAGINQCLTKNENTFNLSANQPNIGSGIWSQISGPASIINNVNNHNTAVSTNKPGNYQYVWTISSNSCINMTADTVLITIPDSIIVANAGTDKSICGNSILLNANKPSLGIGIWTQIAGNGTAIISSPDSCLTSAINLIDGTYKFRWTITNGACPSTFDDVIYTISSPPSVSSAGIDYNLCGANSNSTYLNATIPNNGIGQWVQVSGPNTAVFANNLLNNTQVSGLTNGTYKFRWIVSSGSSCTPSFDDVFITVALPAKAGIDQNLCNLNATTLIGNIGSKGTWTQITGPPVAISQIPADNCQANVSGLLANTSYTFRYTIPKSPFGCPSSFDDIVINNGSSTLNANAGDDSSYCNVQSFGLNGSLPGIGETGIWSIVSGPNGATFTPNANTPNAKVINASPGTYILRWTISNSTCSNSDVRRVENYAIPTLANAGIDKKVCFNQATLSGNIPSKGNGTWSQISGPINTPIISINNPTSEVIGFDNIGDYKYVWSISTNSICPTSRDTVLLRVTDLSPTIANAGNDQYLCNQDTIILNANNPNIGNGRWIKLNNNDVDIISPITASTYVINISPNIYQFIWKITNKDSSCSSQDTVSIFNSIEPNNSNAGPDDTFCVFSDVLLRANTPILGTNGEWSLLSGPNIPVFISPTNPITKVVGLTTGTYRFAWSIKSPNCAISTDEVNITIINNADLAIAGTNQNICGTSITLNANNPSQNNKGQWTQFSGPNTVNIDSPNLPNTTISSAITGSYRFVWKIFNERCFNTDTLQILFSEPAIVNAGSDFSICNNINDVLLSQAVIGGSATEAYWTLTSGNGDLSNTNITSTPNLVSYIPVIDYHGDVVIRITTNDPPGICPEATDDINIFLRRTGAPLILKDDSIVTKPNTSISIPILDNDIIYEDQPLSLCDEGAIIKSPLHGTIKINNDETIVYTPNVSFAGLDSFQYQVCEFCDAKGKDSAWVFIFVEDNTIPNAISPNGDGINDVFITPYINPSISIWNRNGISVYENNRYENDWNGSYKNNPLPDGTYYYILKYRTDTNNEISKMGFIILSR